MVPVGSFRGLSHGFRPGRGAWASGAHRSFLEEAARRTAGEPHRPDMFGTPVYVDGADFPGVRNRNEKRKLGQEFIRPPFRDNPDEFCDVGSA